jgi:hypothetical protein
MSWWLGALLATLGGLAAEAAEVDLARRRYARLPWNRKRASKAGDGTAFPPLRVYLLGISARLIVAGIVGGAYAAGGQITGEVGALTIGVGASLLISRIGDQKDLGDMPHPSELPPTRETMQIELPREKREATGHG